MALFSDLLSFFTQGAVGIAEQFIRGFTNIKSFGELMVDRFAAEYQPTGTAETDFLDLVNQASGPASDIMTGGIPKLEDIPPWYGSQTPGEFIQTGLARVGMRNSLGEEQFHTHIPFQFHNLEALNLESILERIRDSIESGGQDPSFYEPDIDRFEQLIRYHTIMGLDSSVEAELYSLFQGV